MLAPKLDKLPDIDWKMIGVQLEKAENDFCRFLYIVGIQTVRILKHRKHNLTRFFKPFTSLCFRLYWAALGKRFLWLRQELHSIGKGVRIARSRLAEARKRGPFFVVKECFHITGISFRLHKSFLFSAFKLAAPLVSVWILLFTVQYWRNMNYGLILENKGKQIAVIQNENTYEQATEMVNQRMVHDKAGNDAKIDFEPNFRLSAIGGSYATASFVCDKLIEQSNGIIEEASGLYMDGELLGVVKSGADLRFLIQKLLDQARGGNQSVTAQFVQNVEIVNGLFPTTAIISSQEMNQIITGTSKSGIIYTVKDGDTVTSIAKANHTTISALNKINGNQLGDSIHPGDLINLEVAVPRLSVELVKTETYQMPIPYKTITQNDDSQYTDYTKVLTQGANGAEECVDKVYTVNGVETKRESVTRTVLSKAVDKVVLTGTKKRANTGTGVSSGSLMWPVPSLHTITTYFTWRWGSFHYGIDISGSGAYGRTIVAADGGVVEAAGWDGGYGNRVIIRHNSTVSTLYGHCSKILVEAGQTVSKGQAIAKVGSTGNSTGPHCHFEVIKNGTKVNPLQYVNR